MRPLKIATITTSLRAASVTVGLVFSTIAAVSMIVVTSKALIDMLRDNDWSRSP